jgi:hypothetical protein
MSDARAVLPFDEDLVQDLDRLSMRKIASPESIDDRSSSRRTPRLEPRARLITSTVDLFSPITERWRDSKDPPYFYSVFRERALCTRPLVCFPLTGSLRRRFYEAACRKNHGRNAAPARRNIARATHTVRHLPAIKLEDKAYSREN